MTFRPLQSIRWRLILSGLAAVCVPLAIFTWWIGTMLWDFYLRQLEQELQSVAWSIAESARPLLGGRADHAGILAIEEQWSRHSRIRLVIADRAGVIHAATVKSLVGERVSEDRTPGLLQALAGTDNATVWKHPDYDFEDTMYVNVPVVEEEGRRVGAVRVSLSLAQIEEKLARVERTLGGAMLLYVSLLVALMVALAASIVRPVETLTRSARVLASGDLSHRAEAHGTLEIRQLAETMNQMAERLQALEAIRRRYVSDVSHELRAPLASIRGMAETLLQHGRSDPTLRERYLPRIVTQTERLARLATQLLDLEQIEGGTESRRLGEVDLRAVIDEAVATTATQKRVTDVEVDLRATTDLPHVRGDRDRLVQMLINLLDNAFRHVPPGGKVQVVAEGGDGGTVRLEVSDTGPGIPPEHLPHVFERFYRVDPARSASKGGSGLGLSIVRQIVHAHGGTIRAESEPGRGTRFVVVLPLEGSQTAQEVPEPCPTPAS